MRTNDPHGLMVVSVLRFAQSLPAGSHMGIVVFDTRPTVALKLTDSNANDFLPLVRKSLSAVNYRGRWTDIPGAIERSLYELRVNGRDRVRKSVILFTDGIVETGSAARDQQRSNWLRTELAQEAHDSSVRIIGVAFTDTADYELMQSLAHSTGGERFHVQKAEEIAAAFARVAALLATPSPPPTPSPPKTATPPPSRPPGSTPGFSWGTTLLVLVPAGLVLLAGAAWLVRRARQRLPVEATLTDLTDPLRCTVSRRSFRIWGAIPRAKW